jgi:serine/threonine-protein kinase
MLLKLESEQIYHLTRLIARGGMGSVYVAEQLGEAGFTKTVAIKMIRRRLAQDPVFIERFIAEAKLVADLVHENIVQVHNLQLAGGEHFMVMEYVDGVTLEKFIARHVSQSVPLPIDLGAFITSRICRGLEYAHAARTRSGERACIVHRDICPKNILINREGVVKISDFGIAQAMSAVRSADEILMGRAEYMAPEQVRGEPTDRLCDIYSLGVVMYELLTGRIPARGSGSVERLHRQGVAYAQPIQQLRPEVPDALAEIVARTLEPDTEQRYHSAREMGVDIEYQLYHRGYGPTNQTLGEYVRWHFSAPAAGG